MAENKGKFYMTTAIAYTSGKPHIGKHCFVKGQRCM